MFEYHDAWHVSYLLNFDMQTWLLLIVSVGLVDRLPPSVHPIEAPNPPMLNGVDEILMTSAQIGRFVKIVTVLFK